MEPAPGQPEGSEHSPGFQDRLRRVGQWREVGCLTAEVDTVVSKTPNHNSEEEDSHNVTEVTPGIIEL